MSTVAVLSILCGEDGTERVINGVRVGRFLNNDHILSSEYPLRGSNTAAAGVGGVAIGVLTTLLSKFIRLLEVGVSGGSIGECSGCWGLTGLVGAWERCGVTGLVGAWERSGLTGLVGAWERSGLTGLVGVDIIGSKAGDGILAGTI